MATRTQLFHFFLRNPRIATVLRRASYLKWRAEVYVNRFVRTPEYDSDEILYVSPAQIQHYIGGKLGNRFTTRGTVRSGPWDENVGAFEGWDVYRAIRDHYRHRVPWDNTEYYQRGVETLRREGRFRGETDLNRVFRRIENLYESIQANGFLPMAEAADLNFDHWEQQGPLERHDDITVAIDRFGHILLQDGKHRLAIAKVLGLSRIPVAVGVRHTQWVQFVKEVESFCTKRGAAYQQFTHPDLQHFPVQHRDPREKVIERRILVAPGSLLDLGAYFGFFSNYFAAKGWTCTAVEHHPKHAYFIRKLAAAEGLSVSVLETSLFDLPRPIKTDVVLALNIFHHYLKTEALFNDLRRFLCDLQGIKQLFLETHRPDDPIMHGAFKNFTPNQFAEFVSQVVGLPKVEWLSKTSRDRDLFILER